MFWKKKETCRNCSFAVEKDWEFCPNCGESMRDFAPKRKMINPLAIFGGGMMGLDQIFKQMEKQMQEMDKEFAQGSFEMEKMPRLRVVNPRGGSISISIVQAGGKPPHISVKTGGEFKQLEPEIKKELGVPASLKRAEEFDKKLSTINETAEPETEMKKVDGKISYTIKLPDVKKVDDIQIKRLPNSVEIRAVCGNKLYFKLFEAPQNLGIVEKNFKDGFLRIVLG